jgi:uncharacterized protein (TIGR01777 family)
VVGKKALVTGATGLIGRRLVRRLEHPNVVSRDPARAVQTLGDGVTAHAWSDDKRLPDAALDGVDAVFHLAGEAVAESRLTPERRKRILDSRVQGTCNVVASLGERETKPRVLVAASATGFYGDRGDELLEEDAPRGSDFLSEVCAAWEEETKKAEAFGIRAVSLRIGIVLDPDGGAIKTMVRPFRMGIAGRLGNGRQWMPWIHAEDVVRLIVFLAEKEDARGPFNVTAPGIVTNAEFTKTFARVLHRPAVLPVPRFALKALYGDLADSVLASQRAAPSAALRLGFEFLHPQLDPALRDLLDVDR